MIHLAILGSTKGTDLEAIINAINNKTLEAKIEVVISDKSDAYILERARNHKINSVLIESKGVARQEYDKLLLNELAKYKIDLVLLIGYMKILSPEFVNEYRKKILNVHPSLLPKFAGGMNLDVHKAVIDAGEKETGCTIHFVDEGVDSGDIIIQKKCPISPADTPETLKQKVQKLEGGAFIEAIKKVVSF